MLSFINGILNVLRLLIESNNVLDTDGYKSKLAGINDFDFKQFESSQYRKMGEEKYIVFFTVDKKKPKV